MRILLSLALGAALLAPEVSAAAMGILHGSGHVYAISSPAGWRLDSQTGKQQGVEAIAYPIGKSPGNSEAIFTVDTGRSSASDRREAFVEGFFSRLSEREPLEVEAVSALATRGDGLAEVRSVRGETFGYGLIAFVFEADVVIRISLMARTSTAFQSSREAFERFVGSYEFLGTSFRSIESVPHLVRIARANVASPGGKAYDSLVARHFVEQHAEALERCIVAEQGPSLAPFQLLVLVGADAKVSRVVTSPTHEISSCMAADVAGTQLPPAPGADWWVRLGVGPSQPAAKAPE